MILFRILLLILVVFMTSAIISATLYNNPRHRKRPFYFLVDYEVEAFEISDTGELNYTSPKHRGGIFR